MVRIEQETPLVLPKSAQACYHADFDEFAACTLMSGLWADSGTPSSSSSLWVMDRCVAVSMSTVGSSDRSRARTISVSALMAGPAGCAPAMWNDKAEDECATGGGSEGWRRWWHTVALRAAAL